MPELRCTHFWVERTDGYEEYCGATICLICGEYGCYHDLQDELEKLHPQLHDRREQLAKDLGIEGKEHELENTQKRR